MFPDSTWNLTKSTTGRYGRDREVIMSRTVAEKISIPPGTLNVRDFIM